MSISTYSELQTAVQNWLNRPDLSAYVPDFITVAESMLNKDLNNLRAMETQTTLSTVSGTSTVALPTDMLEMKRVQVISSPNRVLKYLSADELAATYTTGLTGMPECFAVIGGNIELGPIPDAVYSLQLTYFQKIPALSNSNTTNWLLTAWPDAYLWAALAAAQPFIMNDARLATFEKLYAQAVEGVNGVDWYSGSTMRVQAR